jgi:hypothetical protein
MHARNQRRIIQARARREAKQSASFIRHPNLISHYIPHPHTQVGGFRRKAHALLAVAQGRLCQPAAAELDQQRHDQQRFQKAQGGNRCSLMFHRRNWSQSNIGTAWCDSDRAAACASSPARMRMPNWAAFRPISSNAIIEPPTIPCPTKVRSSRRSEHGSPGRTYPAPGGGEGLAGSILKHREVKHDGVIRQARQLTAQFLHRKIGQPSKCGPVPERGHLLAEDIGHLPVPRPAARDYGHFAGVRMQSEHHLQCGAGSSRSSE